MIKDNDIFISVIIPTKDRQRLLKNAIDSLLDQSLDKEHYEIVIIDQSSGNKTKEYINRLTHLKDHKIRYIYNKIQGLHSSRNIGAKKAIGEILVFTDDDIIADKDYLKAIYNSFKSDPTIALMTGKVLPTYESSKIPDWLGFFWAAEGKGKYIWEISLIDLGDDFAKISPNYIFGCNYIIRRDLFIKYKGTNPDAFQKSMIKYSGNSETALGYKIEKGGLKIIYNPNIIIKHLVTKERITPKYFYGRNYFEGIKNSYTDIRKTKKKLPTKQLLRDFYLIFKNLIIIIFKFYSKANRINFICSLNRFKGKMKHKWWVLKDNKLYEYIMRDNYFDNGKEFL